MIQRPGRERARQTRGGFATGSLRAPRDARLVRSVMSRGRFRTRGAALSASGLVLLVVGLSSPMSRGDEPGLFNRIFRMGTGARPAPSPAPSKPEESSTLPPESPAPGLSSPGPRLVPQPRVQRPFTESDPILTRVAI